MSLLTSMLGVTSQSQVDAAIAAAVGGSQFDFVDSFMGSPPVTGGSAGTVTQNKVYLVLVRVGRALTVTQMSYFVGTANGNVDLGIYDSADAGTTLTRQASTGSTAAAGASVVQTIALTAPFEFQPGKDYWLAFGTDSATLTTTRNNGVVPTALALFKNRLISKASGWSTGLPASITSLAGEGVIPWIMAS